MRLKFNGFCPKLIHNPQKIFWLFLTLLIYGLWIQMNSGEFLFNGPQLIVDDFLGDVPEPESGHGTKECCH